MIALGFLLGALIASPVAFAMGWIARADRIGTHERADITPALRRSSR